MNFKNSHLIQAAKFLRVILLIILVSFACSFFLWYQKLFPPKFKTGEKSPVQIIISEETKIPDIQSTEREKELAKRNIVEAFFNKPKIIRDNAVNEVSLNNINSLITSLEDLSKAQKKGFLSKDSVFTSILLSEDEIDYILEDNNLQNLIQDISKTDIQNFVTELKSKKKNLNRIKSSLRDLRNKLINLSKEEKLYIYENKVYISSTEEWLEIKPILIPLAKKLLSLGYLGYLDQETIKVILPKENIELSDQQLKLIENILQLSLKPNLKLQFDNLSENEQKALMEIKTLWKIVKAGSVIVEKGEILTDYKVQMLKDLKLNERELNFDIFRKALWSSLLLVLGLCLFIQLEKYPLSFRQMLLLGFLMIGASAFIGFTAYKQPALIPLAAIAMTVGLFFKPSIGFAAGTLFAILCMEALSINIIALIPAFVGVIVGTVLAEKANNRADLAYAGIWLALSQMGSFAFLKLLNSGSEHIYFDSFSLSELFLQGFGGLITGLLVSSIMPYLESFFGVITRFRLLELSDPNQPLLKRLHDEAPGTYEHTLVVADLAQNAALKIEVDDELVRVGILYHDIGKLYNPQIFIENQFGGANPHENMTPEQSAKAIIDHVSKGLEIAQKYGLPDTIQDFIPAHQGNSRAGHFYLKACQQNPDLKDDSAFRYPGPKPQSKETGIAMLADTVEATIRSLKTTDKNLVKETIKNLINSRVQDNQLNESNLNQVDLNSIAESFYESWKNKNHERVRYISDLKRN
jgi:cyclic-di-AMP phosphodiesterase PgpH